MDNNAAERALRAVALGRKNYLFALRNKIVPYPGADLSALDGWRNSDSNRDPNQFETSVRWRPDAYDGSTIGLLGTSNGTRTFECEGSNTGWEKVMEGLRCGQCEGEAICRIVADD